MVQRHPNADMFVKRLARQELLVRDPIIESALRGEPQDLSQRSVQRHFLYATRLTQGISISDVVDQAGYADQAHLTRSLKYFIGKTPVQIVRKSEPEQLSLLYQTEFIP